MLPPKPNKENIVKFNFDHLKNKNYFKMKTILGIALLATVLFQFQLYAQTQDKSNCFGIGFEIGNWSPSNLDNDVTLTPISKIKNHPYIGLLLMKPWRYGLTLRSSIGYWKYSGTNNSLDDKKMEIVTLLLDLKYALINDVRVLPYVSYGIGWFLGSESAPQDALLEFDNKSEMGLGFNVGTGFDFKVFREIYVTMEFRYLYVKFNKTIAFTDIYNGPRISIGMNYLF